MVLTVVLESVTTLLRGLGLFQQLIGFLYRSGLCGPLLRSMDNERKTLIKFQIIWGEVKKRLSSSILYYQAWEKGFWTVL